MANDITEFEKARIKKDARKIAKMMKNTPLHHRGFLFNGIANHFDAFGEIPLCTLFAKIAGTYVRKRAGGQENAENNDAS